MIRVHTSLTALTAVLALAACSSGGVQNAMPSQNTIPVEGAQPVSPGMPGDTGMQQQTQTATSPIGLSDDVSVLEPLTRERTVGSLVGPNTGDVNPYGLTVAPATAGTFDTGDMAVCDFNDKANVQGTGTEIVGIDTAIGSIDRHVIDGPKLTGCNALALAPDNTIWAADFSANDVPIISSSGHWITAEFGGPWHHPFGIAFAITANVPPAFYVSNAGDGSLVRIGLVPTITYTVIATGFPVNHGVPGSILAPSGLSYLASLDRLYIVDGTNNTLYAIDNISKVGANGIVVKGQTFSGPNDSDAHVIYHGKPLNGPISSAILPGGHIVVGNTLDPTGFNKIVEINPEGKVLDVENVDKGAAGAIFGVAATGTSPADAKVFFNDDNTNALVELSH